MDRPAWLDRSLYAAGKQGYHFPYSVRRNWGLRVNTIYAKVNVDAALSKNGTLAAVVAVARDTNGKFMEPQRGQAEEYLIRRSWRRSGAEKSLL
jgi:hypothetical protein